MLHWHCKSHDPLHFSDGFTSTTISSSVRNFMISCRMHFSSLLRINCATSFSVVLRERVNLSYSTKLYPALPSRAQRPVSCQYDTRVLGHPMCMTKSTSLMSKHIPRVTVATMHLMWLSPFLNSLILLSLESWCVLLWYISSKNVLRVYFAVYICHFTKTVFQGATNLGDCQWNDSI
jgi:hypothetical protein